jgi:hypothetical protein
MLWLAGVVRGKRVQRPRVAAGGPVLFGGRIVERTKSLAMLPLVGNAHVSSLHLESA